MRTSFRKRPIGSLPHRSHPCPAKTGDQAAGFDHVIARPRWGHDRDRCQSRIAAGRCPPRSRIDPRQRRAACKVEDVFKKDRGAVPTRA